MNRFRNHRVVIASLFLPVTIETQSPEARADKNPPPTRLLQEPAKDVNTHKRTGSKGPLSSIVDDLAVKVGVLLLD